MELQNPRLWSVRDVCSWLREHAYKVETVRSLAENEVDGQILLSLTVSDVRDELGVKSLAERRRLITDITVLQGNVFTRDQNGNKEYVSIKASLKNWEHTSVLDEEMKSFVDFQIAEIEEFESSLKDHMTATDIQTKYNKLFLTEQRDEIAAKAADNVGDQMASSRLSEVAATFAREDRYDVPLMILNGSEEKSCDASVSSLESSFELIMECKEEELKKLNPPTPTADSQYLVSGHVSGQSDRNLSCLVCGHVITAHHHNFAIQAPCGDTYCKSCLRDWLTSASSDITLLPIKCCKQMLPREELRRLMTELLSPQLADKLERLSNEKLCSNKMYCPGVKCSTFIDLDKAEQYVMANSVFKCPNRTCSVLLCLNCKAAAHDTFISCVTNQERMQREEDETAVDMKGHGYQRCRGCTAFVELIHGCNHMTCRCKHEFCYACGADWKPRQCDCELMDMRRIENYEDRFVPQHIVGPERAAAVAARVQAIRDMIVREEDCMHHSIERTDEYEGRRNKPRCSLCNRRLNLFGYVCDNCPRRLCIGCYKHRW